MNGSELIAAERRRQIEAEGYRPELDAEHYRSDQLARAAAAYLLDQPERWPWPPSTFKRTGRVRDLVKAGALIAAEIDRLAGPGGADPKETRE